MLNQVVITGRIAKTTTKKEEEREYSIITIAVSRSYKNDKGEYETDFIPVFLSNQISKNVNKYCKKGDLIGVRGKLEKKKNLIVMAERVSFLSSKRD